MHIVLMCSALIHQKPNMFCNIFSGCMDIFENKKYEQIKFSKYEILLVPCVMTMIYPTPAFFSYMMWAIYIIFTHIWSHFGVDSDSIGVIRVSS